MIYCQLVLAMVLLYLFYAKIDPPDVRDRWDGIELIGYLLLCVFLWLCGAFSQIIPPPWGSP